MHQHMVYVRHASGTYHDTQNNSIVVGQCSKWKVVCELLLSSQLMLTAFICGMCLAILEVKYPVLALGVGQRQMEVSKGDKTWNEDMHLRPCLYMCSQKSSEKQFCRLECAHLKVCAFLI